MAERDNARAECGLPLLDPPIISREAHDTAIEELTRKLEATPRYFRNGAPVAPPPAPDEAADRAMMAGFEDDVLGEWRAVLEAAELTPDQKATALGVMMGLRSGHAEYREARRRQAERMRAASSTWKAMLGEADEIVRNGGVDALLRRDKEN